LPRNSRPSRPFQLKKLQAMILGGCFTVFFVNC
jgi:hypothetical protein